MLVEEVECRWREVGKMNEEMLVWVGVDEGMWDIINRVVGVKDMDGRESVIWVRNWN